MEMSQLLGLLSCCPERDLMYFKYVFHKSRISRHVLNMQQQQQQH